MLINVPVKQRIDMNANQAIQSAVKAAEEALNGKGRILLRPSGTEPKLRVMVEGQEGDLVKKLASQIAEVVAEQAK